MPEITTYTLGCKVNYADTQSLVEKLDVKRAVPFEIIGTCCVTAEGERQSRKEVRRAVRRVGSGGKVFVTGCAARLDNHAFQELGENVEVVVGELADVAARISAGAAGSQQDASTGVVSRAAERRTRFFLKVQDGCSRACSYCVIPRVRGRPRSLSFVEVAGAARAKVDEGYPELVVNGINVGSYSDNGADLASFLEMLAGTEGLKRLRLSSVEMAHVTPRLLNVIRKHRVIGRHLHLPLQSGDDGVLMAMRRQYGAGEFREGVRRIRQALPEVNLTTDVIVGFPTEDERAFENTMGLVSDIGFSKVHVFTYSPRPGAAASRFGDPVKAVEKRRRSRLLRRLSDDLGEKHRQRKLGRVSEVLLESLVGPGVYGGYSADYTRFVIEGEREGALVKAMAVSVKGSAIVGKLVAASGRGQAHRIWIQERP